MTPKCLYSLLLATKASSSSIQLEWSLAQPIQYTASLRAVCWLNQSTILAREKIEVIMHCNFLHASFIFQNTHHPNMRHAQPTPPAVGLAASHWDIMKLFYFSYLHSRNGQWTPNEGLNQTCLKCLGRTGKKNEFGHN